MAKFMDKFYNIMGLGDEYEEVEERTTNTKSTKDEETEKNIFSMKRPTAERNDRNLSAPVVSLASERQKKDHKVVVVDPKSFDEAQSIADHLKNRRQVILNLENTDREMAQRMIDFISGTTYALNGSMQKVGANIFVFAPSHVDISGDFVSENTIIRPMAWASKG
ncbi:cell division protein SepF [Heliorestis acidaminivorans]|uniref:Cell division protein SepF n=1 Tax=Heliorestis acidaminivorans TaxID=553427 RepID=A0A6I0F419_9FIRM|nr:cell division protein SepF [Heliorestis acidaminivorans]KAB2954500.1 cell division protein SepF [Heliorestis acidaminivorans]